MRALLLVQKEWGRDSRALQQLAGTSGSAQALDAGQGAAVGLHHAPQRHWWRVAGNAD